MDYHISLVIVYVILLLSSLFFFRAKLISPSVIFSASFTAMLILSLIAKEMLGISVNWITFSVFSVAGFIFVGTELIVFLCFCSFRSPCRKELCGASFFPFYYRKSLRVFWNCILVISVGLTFLSIYKSTGGGSFLSRMNVYRNLLIFESENVKFRFLLSQIRKIAVAMSVIYNYILIYNTTVLHRSPLKYRAYIFAQILYVVLSFFGGGARQPVVELVVHAALIYISLHLQRSESYKIWRMVLCMIPLAVLAMPLFTATAALAGRANIKRNTVEYIAKYVCGGLYAFNLHTADPARTQYWGQSSFSDIYVFLQRFGVAENVPDLGFHEFDRYGNTLTMFGRWYEDFGAAGVFVMSFLVSLFFSALFYRFIAFSTPHSRPFHHLARILYCKLLIALVWAGYDDRIRPLLAFYTQITLILIAITYIGCSASKPKKAWSVSY